MPREITPIDNQWYKPVLYCPFCGSGPPHLILNLVEWEARSLDSCDKNNHGVIEEHQCELCSLSFWTTPTVQLGHGATNDPQKNRRTG